MNEPTSIPPHQWEQVEAIFHDALERAPEERAAFIESACGDDPELRELVSRLLAGHERGLHHEGFLEPVLSVGGEPAQTAELPEAAPRQVGQYHLKRVIGAGGMGTVYEAVQEHPRRTVAVKVMKRGIASASALRRFEYESQVLARLHHPGIAQIHEAGVHDDGTGGVPYFAMEYIPSAQSLTDYADDRDLDTRQKLELFKDVCSAVHHGHQKGIIHRDLKPENILVDADGQVKVIDFGVARATDSDLAVTTQQTEIGQLIGSVQYMSPEQVEADPHDLDIRSDVYTLGVVLYELLAGRTPYDATHVSLLEATRVIREAQPKRMSAFNHALRGDLETIVAHAMEKDRNRRYESANELRSDLDRYLKNEPIIARPPSLTYQLRVFARRNRVIVGAAAAFFLVLTAATIISTGFAVSATRAARAEAEAAQRSENVAEFLQTILTSAAPEYARGREVTVRQVLDEAALRVATDLDDEPFTEAVARRAIGRSYQSLGAYDEAERHLRQALELEQSIHRGDGAARHPDVVDAMIALGGLMVDRGRIDEGESLLNQALATAIETQGEAHPLTADAMSWVATCLLLRDRYEESEAMMLRALDVMRQAYGEEHEATLDLYSCWALVVNDAGRFAEAEPHFRRILELTRRVHGEDHPRMAKLYNNLGWSLVNQAKYAEAEGQYRRALELDRRIRGNDHPHTGLVLSNLAHAVMLQGRIDEAEAHYREALEILRASLGDTHELTAFAAIGLGWTLGTRGRHEEAMVYNRQALDMLRAAHGEEHRTTARAYQAVAENLTALGRHQEAEPFLRRSLEIVVGLVGEEDDATARAYNELAFNFSVQGRHAEAEPLFQHALDIRLHLLGDDHPYTLLSMHNAARVQLDQGRAAEAEPMLRRVVESSDTVLPEGHWHGATYRMTYGRCLRMLERYEEAETNLLQAHVCLAQVFGEAHERTRAAVEELITLYDVWGRTEEAERWRRELVDSE